MSNLSNKLAERNAAPERTGDTISDLLKRQQPAIARALPRHISAERFARIVLTEVRRTPKLLKCEPTSLLAACMLAAQLGLEPGPLGHAYLVPFGNQVTFIPGYRGLIDLARRSGNIVSLVAREVCANDQFEFEYGLDEKLVHKPALVDRGDVVAYYAVAKYTGGGHTILVMSPADVNKHRDRSKAKDSGPWVTDYDAMAKKTCIRAIAKFLPLSVEMATAIDSDERVLSGLDDLGDVIDVDPVDDTTEALPAAPADPETGEVSA